MSNELVTYNTSRGWGYQWVRKGSRPLVRWDEHSGGYPTEQAALDGAMADAAEFDAYYGTDMSAAVERETASRG